MIYEKIEDFLKNAKTGLRLVALDVGTKTIGVALSDRDWNLATPKTTLLRKGNEKDITILNNFFKENSIGGIIIGLPLSMDDRETNISKFIRRFTDVLSKKVELPIFFVDERLSSFMAEDFMIDDMETGFKKTKKLIDQVAASYILESFLNLIKTINN